jgi:hypothetical protein
MLKHRRENRLIHCLVCWKCGGRTGPNHYTLENGGATCGLCGDRNPMGNLRRMPLNVLQATYEIIVCFVPRDGINCHGLHVDCRRALGPWVHVGGDETMVRMLMYLGATQEQDRPVRGPATKVGSRQRARQPACCEPQDPSEGRLVEAIVGHFSTGSATS